MVICLERGADLHTDQLMPLPLTVSSFSKIQIGFTFLVPAYPGSPGQRAIKRACVCGLWSPKTTQGSKRELPGITSVQAECPSLCLIQHAVLAPQTHTNLTALCLGLPG